MNKPRHLIRFRCHQCGGLKRRTGRCDLCGQLPLGHEPNEASNAANRALAALNRKRAAAVASLATAPKVGLGYTGIIRRGPSGWTWLLMMQDLCVAHGLERTQSACRSAVSLAKAAREKGSV